MQKKAVGAGAMTLGIVYNGGVLLAADRRFNEKLIVVDSVKKTAKIDEHVGSTFAGLTSDARVLVKKCRQFAQQHRLTYGEPVDVEGVVKYISDMEQAYTQYGGIRPFGISFLIGGVDKKGAQLYLTEPSGIYTQYYAKAIGAGASDADLILEKKFKPGLKKEDAMKLALEVFKTVLGKEFSSERLESITVTQTQVEAVKV